MMFIMDGRVRHALETLALFPSFEINIRILKILPSRIIFCPIEALPNLVT